MTKDYLVVYVKGKGDNAAFMGYSPDVLRCISAGDDLTDMRRMMKEALEAHLAWMAKDGDALPQPRATNVEFDPEIWDEVDYYIVEHLTVLVPESATFAETIDEAVAA